MILPSRLLVAALMVAPALATAGDRMTPGRSAGKAREARHSKGDDVPPQAEQAPDVKPLAIVGADIHPVEGADIPGGTLLLREGRIEALLPADRMTALELKSRGYEILDAKGLQAWPGLVAAGASGMGLSPDAWEGGAQEAVTLGLAESFNAWSDEVELMASAGITSALVHRSAFSEGGSPLVGRGAMLKMSYGEPRGVKLLDPAALFASPGLLGAPGRRSLQMALEAAREARRGKNWEPEKAPWPRLLLEAADGKLPVFMTADLAGDVAGSIAIAHDFGFKVVLYHSTESWTLADELAEAGVAAVQHVRTSWGAPRADRRLSTGGGLARDAPLRLLRAGVETVVSPIDDGLVLWGVAGRDLLNLPLEAAYAQRGGLTAQEAIESITMGPAKLLGVEDRIGSLREGKDADVILVDGDPLDYRAFVRFTIVNGKVVYAAKDHRFWGWAVERRMKSLGETVPAPPPKP